MAYQLIELCFQNYFNYSTWHSFQLFSTLNNSKIYKTKSLNNGKNKYWILDLYFTYLRNEAIHFKNEAQSIKFNGLTNLNAYKTFLNMVLEYKEAMKIAIIIYILQRLFLEAMHMFYFMAMFKYFCAFNVNLLSPSTHWNEWKVKKDSSSSWLFFNKLKPLSQSRVHC